MLLLLGWDIETNPGPDKAGYQPRGALDLNVGFSQATSARMKTCLERFCTWLMTKFNIDLDVALHSAESANLCLRAYGMDCFAEGRPRYHLVYAITGVQQLHPEFRLHLGGAWQVDKKWQLQEPGQCRAVLSAPLVRAILCLALLWQWDTFAGVVALGFSGMLHPNEFVHLTRQDLVFPEDALTLQPVMYVHIKNPKTARFARRQHVKIGDVSVLALCWGIFNGVRPSGRLFNGSMAVFRRQWNHLLDHLEIPRKQMLRGATPGTLRGSGATDMYLQTENLSQIQWRGRWSRLRTLEYYIQEVAAQQFLFSLSKTAKARVQLLEASCGNVCQHMFPFAFEKFCEAG
eukprot:Skav202172  [mRNA]  locus=scaffold482:47687:48724:+ [translate_table: standard]